MNYKLRTKRRGFISEHGEETKPSSRKRGGFTLLELLVVITIIGLLASVGLASYTRAQARARDAKRQSDITSLRNALEIYYSENNVYLLSTDNKQLYPDLDQIAQSFKYTP